MFRNVTVDGVQASLQWGYHTAARLGKWTVTRVEGVTSVTAVVESTDAFRVSQRPLVFVAPIEGGAWRWPVVELQMTGASLTATLGPKEK